MGYAKRIRLFWFFHTILICDFIVRRSLLCASASLFDSRILNCENLICRGIEVVITGLTRNQFVPKAHEGSNPSLCAKKIRTSLVGVLVFLHIGRERSPVRKAERGLRIPQAHSESRGTEHSRYLRREEMVAKIYAQAEQFARFSPRAAYPSLCFL